MERYAGTSNALINGRSQDAYCTIPTVWHSGKGKTMETEDQWMSGIAGVAGGRKDGMNRAWRTFRAVKSLCMIPYWWINVIRYLSKPTERTARRATPRVSGGLGWWWRVRAGNRCTPGGDADGGGGPARVGGGVHRESLYFSLNFSVTQKPL